MKNQSNIVYSKIIINIFNNKFIYKKTQTLIIFVTAVTYQQYQYYQYNHHSMISLDQLKERKRRNDDLLSIFFSFIFLAISCCMNESGSQKHGYVN